MDDTKLNLGIWIYYFNCLWKPLESIHTGNKDFFHAPILQFRDNLKPEFGTLVFRSPHAKNLWI